MFFWVIPRPGNYPEESIRHQNFCQNFSTLIFPTRQSRTLNFQLQCFVLGEYWIGRPARTADFSGALSLLKFVLSYYESDEIFPTRNKPSYYSKQSSKLILLVRNMYIEMSLHVLRYNKSLPCRRHGAGLFLKGARSHQHIYPLQVIEEYEQLYINGIRI